MKDVDARRVEDVFDGAVGLSEEALGPYLDAACGGDAALRRAVLDLLAADARADERAPERIAARALLADAKTVLEQEPDPDASEERQVPRALGGFEIVRKLGEGGMGVVYEAYDARLERRVAVKLVRVDGGGKGTTAQGLLLKEARALAKVVHPNVVAVHEVGIVGVDVFVVMELVEGETLSAWLRRSPRTWREVLARYVEAGRGLAAAHAAGVVHRDFKPENVLLGADGRARVVDFGLARAGTSTSTSTTPSSIDHTFAGVIVGTPSYMSPEHFRGEAIDPQSDQFSFAAALYRGLFGAPPFSGETFTALREAVLGGATPSLPEISDVPPRIDEAILRALSLDPDERFPSMTELLGVLESELAKVDLDTARSRRKRRLAAAVLVVVAALTALPVGDGPAPASTAKGLLALGFVALGTLLVIGIVMRRALLESPYDRRIAALFVLPVLGFLVHRSLAIRLGTPAPDILVADAISIAVLLAFAGLVLERWMLLGVVPPLVYAVLATLFPAWAGPGFASLLCILAALPVVYWRTPRRVRRGEKKSTSGVGSGPRSADS